MFRRFPMLFLVFGAWLGMLPAHADFDDTDSGHLADLYRVSLENKNINASIDQYLSGLPPLDTNQRDFYNLIRAIVPYSPSSLISSTAFSTSDGSLPTQFSASMPLYLALNMVMLGLSKPVLTYNYATPRNDLTLSGALLGWNPSSFPAGVDNYFTNGILGKLDYLPKILQETYNTTEALYDHSSRKTIYEMVDEKMSGISNVVSQLSVNLIYTNLVNSVAAPVDLSLLTNLAVVLYNSFTIGGSAATPEDFLDLHDPYDLRERYSLQSVWYSILSGVWPMNTGENWFERNIKGKVPRDDYREFVDFMPWYEENMMDWYVDANALDYFRTARLFQYDAYNTLETYTFLTNALSVNVVSNTLSGVLAGIFSMFPSFTSISSSGVINVSSSVVSNVTGAIEDVADAMSPTLYPEDPDGPATNAIAEVEEASYKSFLNGLKSEEEDTSFGDAFHRYESTVEGNMSALEGQGSYVVDLVMPYSGEGPEISGSVQIDFELTAENKSKIDSFWELVVKLAKISMSFVFAMKIWSLMYSAGEGITHGTIMPY